MACHERGHVQRVSPRSLAGLYFGQSPVNDRFLEHLDRYAATSYPVLLCGPTGSGKTVLARRIHEKSPRRAGPFVACPLTVIPNELRHVELAGCRRGAFTGAMEDRPGLVEGSHRGTLFLDELHHASLELQQFLLTVVEGSAVRRVGELRERPLDLRIIFATSADLLELTRQQMFLEELYYRVACLVLRVPSLAERRDDILPLATLLLGRSLEELERSVRPRFTPRVAQQLTELSWPGNVRQLAAVCRHIAVMLDCDRPAEIDDLPTHLIGDTPGPVVEALPERVRCALVQSGGNVTEAAETLGLSRQAIYRVLHAADPTRIRFPRRRYRIGTFSPSSPDTA
jgi:two-component system, NtrC family, response regulator HydG